MDKALTQLEELTSEVLQRLSGMAMVDFEAFVHSRNLLIDQLRSDERNDEERARYKERVERILEQDAFILARMEQVKNEALQKLQTLNDSRKQRHAYEAGHGENSFFYDQKN